MDKCMESGKDKKERSRTVSPLKNTISWLVGKSPHTDTTLASDSHSKANKSFNTVWLLFTATKEPKTISLQDVENLLGDSNIETRLATQRIYPVKPHMKGNMLSHYLKEIHAIIILHNLGLDLAQGNLLVYVHCSLKESFIKLLPLETRLLQNWFMMKQNGSSLSPHSPNMEILDRSDMKKDKLGSSILNKLCTLKKNKTTISDVKDNTSFNQWCDDKDRYKIQIIASDIRNEDERKVALKLDQEDSRHQVLNPSESALSLKSIFQNSCNQEGTLDTFGKQECLLSQRDYHRSLSPFRTIQCAALEYNGTSLAYKNKNDAVNMFQLLMKEISEMKIIILESEESVKLALSKYINDEEMKQQLLVAVQNHLERGDLNDTQTHAMALDFVNEQFQQILNELHVTKAMNSSLIKQNQTLESENTGFRRRLEQLKLQCLEDVNNCEMEQILNKGNLLAQNNDKLRVKLSSAQERMEHLSKELQEAERQLGKLSEQVHSLRMEKDSNTLLHCRTTADQHVECAALMKELSSKDQLLKNAVEAGEMLLDEMESLKNLMKDKDVHINWNRVKNANNSFIDVMQMCRGCVNELSRELLATHNQAELSEKQLMKTRRDLSQYQQSCSEMESQLKILKEQLHAFNSETIELSMKVSRLSEDNSLLQEQLSQTGNRNLVLQDELEKLRSKRNNEVKKDNVGKDIQEAMTIGMKAMLESQVKELLGEKNRLLERVHEGETMVKRLQTALEHTEEMFEETKKSYESQLIAVQGDSAKELAGLNENQSKVHAQLCKVLAEKQIVLEKLELLKKEHASLLENSDFKHTLHQKNELLNKELAEAKNNTLTLEAKLNELQLKLSGNLAATNGEMWCQMMFDDDQLLMNELQASLDEKENVIKCFQTQGDSGHYELEKLQKETTNWNNEMVLLKNIVKNNNGLRKTIVRSQNEFYSKIDALDTNVTKKKKGFNILVKEVDEKSEQLQLVEEKIFSTDEKIVHHEKYVEKNTKVTDELQSKMEDYILKLQKNEEIMFMRDQQLENEKIEKMELQNQVNKYEIELLELKNEIKVSKVTEIELNNLLSDVVTRYQHAEDTIKTTEANLEDARNEMKQLLLTIQDLENRNQDLEEVNDSHSEALKELHQEKSQLLQQKQQLSNEISELGLEMVRIEGSLCKLHSEKESLQKDHEELCDKLLQAIQMLMEGKLTQQKYESQISDLAGTISQLQANKVTAEEELKLLKNAVQDTRNSIATLEKEKQRLSEAIHGPDRRNPEVNLQKKVKYLQKAMAVTEEKHRKEKEVMDEHIKFKDETIREKSRHIQSFQERVDRLTDLLDDARERLQHQEQKIGNLHKDFLYTEADKKNLEVYVHELEVQLQNEYHLWKHLEEKTKILLEQKLCLEHDKAGSEREQTNSCSSRSNQLCIVVGKKKS